MSYCQFGNGDSAGNEMTEIVGIIGVIALVVWCVWALGAGGGDSEHWQRGP